MAINCLISIIIPIFNSERYLVSCIESILRQDIRNVEIILINDGSSDNSEIICKGYCSTHKDTMSYIYQDNQGLSLSRNRGIDLANGKYVMFIDSDDLIQKESLTDLKKIITAQKPDVIFGQIEAFKEENVCRDFLEGTLELELNDRSADEIVLSLSHADINIAPSVRYITNIEFIKKHNLYFTNIPYEDVDWSAKILTYVNNIYIYNKKFYKYRLRNNSLSSCKNFEMYHAYSQIIINLYAISEKIVSRHRKEFIHNRCRYLLYRIRNEMFLLDIAERKELEAFFLNNMAMINQLYKGYDF